MMGREEVFVVWDFIVFTERFITILDFLPELIQYTNAIIVIIQEQSFERNENEFR